MGCEVFGYVVTGVSWQEAELAVRGLEHVGKQRVRETRQTLCPIKSYDKAVLRQWLKDNCQEEGWLLDSYLGRQGSVSYAGNQTVLNYSVTKYVEDCLYEE